MDVEEEVRRIRNDRNYFNENHLWIRTKGIGELPKLIRFKYRTAQKILDNVVEKQEKAGKPVRIIILKARQEGMSTYTEGYIFKQTILNPFTDSVVVAHKTKSAIHLFSMSLLFYECLHPALRPMKRYSNRRELLFENPDDRTRPNNPGLRSHMYIGTANDLDLGRSETIRHAHLSEFAFWQDPETTMVSLMQAIPDAAGTSVFIESTANGLGNPFCDMYYGAKRGENDFEAVFIPWYIHEEYRMDGPPVGRVDKYEQWLIDHCGCDEGQIRWRRWAIRNKCNGDIEKFKQEYPATDDEAFLASGTPVFDVARLGAMRRTAPPPRFQGDLVRTRHVFSIIKSDTGNFKIWKEPNGNHTYVLGVDVAEGVRDGDYSAVEVLDREDFEQVAEWHGHVAPDVFGDIVADIGSYYCNALTAVETNGPGIATVGVLRKKYYNLFATVSQDQISRKPSTKIGWVTTVRTRPLIVDAIHQSLNSDLIINSTTLLDELAWFVYVEVVSQTRVSRLHPTAQKGKHDDLVFALGIALNAHIQYPLKNKMGELKKITNALQDTFIEDQPAANIQERILRKNKQLEDPEYRQFLQQSQYDMFDPWGLDD